MPDEFPSARLLEAICFAAEAHRAQRRKSEATYDGARIPYINHPLRVAWRIAERACCEDVDVLRAAVLHDTLEDTSVHYDDLARRFGERVAGLVREVSDDRSLTKQARKAAQVAHASNLSEGAALIKIADKIDNLVDLVEAPPAWTLLRKQEYFDWAARVVFEIRGPNPALLAEFERVLALRPA